MLNSSIRLGHPGGEATSHADFHNSFNPQIPAEQIHDLAACRFLDQDASVIICGPVGVGKSHVEQALGHLACRMGHSTLYLTTSRLLADLGGGHADGTWEPRLRRYLSLDLVIIDDFGMRNFSEQQTEDWYGLFPNPVLAESVLDRLVNSAHHLVINGASYRPLRRPDRATAVTTAPPEQPLALPSSGRDASS